MKIWIKNPTVSTVVQHGGRDVLIHAWGSNENDFDVPMMRVNEGVTLYAITDEEWNALQSRNQK